MTKKIPFKVGMRWCAAFVVIQVAFVVTAKLGSPVAIWLLGVNLINGIVLVKMAIGHRFADYGEEA